VDERVQLFSMYFVVHKTVIVPSICEAYNKLTIYLQTEKH